METRPLSYYMGLNYTVEMTREQETLVARIRELPGCSASVGEDEPVGQLWGVLEEVKKEWLEGAIRERRWIPEPPHAEEDELLRLSEFFEERQLDVNDARKMLYERGIERYSIPLLQGMWLKELSSEGIYRVGSSFPAAPKTDSPGEPQRRALAGDLRSVPLGKSGESVWLRLDGERSEHGYKNIEVLDRTIPTQTATITALTILEASAMEDGAFGWMMQKVRRAINQHTTAHPGEPNDRALHHILNNSFTNWYANDNLKGLSYTQIRSLRWSLALLRHTRVGFDDLPYREQAGLFLKHCEYIRDTVKASRIHAAFLDYGTPEGIGTRKVERLRDQIKATILADVEGLTHLQIAQTMNLAVPRDYPSNKAVPEVRKLVKNGRDLLQRALGGGWKDHAKNMKEETSRFGSLSEEEKDIEIIAERAGIEKNKLRSLGRSSKGRAILDLYRATGRR
jgi:hypothetical protein